ncbi:hypothetical protein [Actinomadura litoris]|uniref:hypothetical protein n=1 Tax=Actinomadura litoris TaxID=2678616 RepID=UPI001FA6F796|nr:hypothetical protein [Actinomadura litoris]
MTYRKGALHRIACTPAEYVRLEHAGWTRMEPEPVALSPEAAVSEPTEPAPPEPAAPQPPRRRASS